MAEPSAASAAAERLPADPADVSEVEVFDRDGVAAVGLGRANRVGDGRPQPSVAGGGAVPVKVKRDRMRRVDWIPARIQDPASHVISVEVKAECGVLTQ